MRRVFRRDLSVRAANKLREEQANADDKYRIGALNVNKEWARARKNNPLKEAVAVLKRMAGPLERCMYCGDSHGTDIEHFRPKAPYPNYMFQWPNMLLCCTECGRFKGDRFPLLAGAPGMIDPSIENPWDFLDFDPDTGNIIARYDPHYDQYDPKGIASVATLQLDRREALARRYQGTFHRIKRIIESALAAPPLDAGLLFQDLSEADEIGLLGWCFDGSGIRVHPLSNLHLQHPDVWSACRAAYRHRQQLQL